MNPYLELIRPVNGLMTAIAVIVGGLLVYGVPVFWNPLIYIAVASAILILGAGNAVNDYYDYAVDKVNKKHRPIPSGRVSRKGALRYSIALAIAGLLLACFLPYIALIIALVNSALLFAYANMLQHKTYVGNVAVSYLVGSTYLFGSAAAWDSSPISVFFTLPLVLFSMSFFANLSREIVKDLEDIKGDKVSFLSRARKAKSRIAERFGIKKGKIEYRIRRDTAITISFVSILIAIAISFLPFIWEIFGYEYLAIVTVSDLAFLYTALSSLKARKKGDYAMVSKRIKHSMLIGLLAFIVGAVLR